MVAGGTGMVAGGIGVALNCVAIGRSCTSGTFGVSGGRTAAFNGSFDEIVTEAAFGSGSLFAGFSMGGGAVSVGETVSRSCSSDWSALACKSSWSSSLSSS
jgi:hypothetical protein